MVVVATVQVFLPAYVVLTSAQKQNRDNSIICEQVNLETRLRKSHEHSSI